jgi:glyoxylase I family protein
MQRMGRIAASHRGSLNLRGLCPLLQVFDMPASLAFYRDVLGFDLVQADPAADQVEGDAFGWVWLRRDNAEVMLNSAYDPDVVRPPAPDPSRVAAHADTALFIGCPDVDAAYEHLQGHGLSVAAPVVAPYGMKQLYVKDPDGFTLCFQWPVETDAVRCATVAGEGG